MSTTRFGFYYILGIFHVEDIRRFQGKLISPFQFIIELEDDVRLLSLYLCPFGFVFGEDVFGLANNCLRVFLFAYLNGTYFMLALRHFWRGGYVATR